MDDDHQAEAPAYARLDPPTWEEVVRTHSARVYRLAYRLTGNVHDAEDLTQEVFVRVFRRCRATRPGTFEGWLHRITTNLFLDMARRKQRIRFEGLADDAAERLPAGSRRPAQAYDDAHLEPDIQAALDALAPEFRAAVVLCDIEGLSYEEIAGDARREARHGPQPDPPWPRPACARRSSTGRRPESEAATRPPLRSPVGRDDESSWRTRLRARRRRARSQGAGTRAGPPDLLRATAGARSSRYGR